MEPLLAKLALYLQLVAAFELSIDDLLLLANSRRHDLVFAAGKFPVQMSEKLNLLGSLAECEKAEPLPEDLSSPDLTKAIEIRNWLAHGAVSRVNAAGTSFSIDIVKIGRPERSSKGQIITRDQRQIGRDDLVRGAIAVQKARLAVEDLSRRIFWTGEGWPSFQPMPVGDPFQLMNSAERIAG